MTAGDTRVGILGLGVYLPPEVRRNDWWPRDLVERWVMQRKAAAVPPSGPLSEGARRVVAALGQQGSDPFLGAVERRILSSELTVFDMEEQAARAALARAGVDRSEIDLLLTYTVVPDYWLGNPACILHHRLGLPRTCFAMHTDVASHAFMMQLALAESMILAGRARKALLVQSCVASRLIAPEDPGAPLVGDGAAATVVGAVSGSRGIEGSIHFADGKSPRTLIASVPGGNWFDEGRAFMHVGDRGQMQEVFLQSADVCKESVDALLDKTRRAASEIDFLCVYQGTPWLSRVVQEHTGLDAARTLETFSRTGYLSGAMIPTNLYFASEEAVLRTDDLVMLTGGGTGVTFGACLLRWGR